MQHKMQANDFSVIFMINVHPFKNATISKVCRWGMVNQLYVTISKIHTKTDLFSTL